MKSKPLSIIFSLLIFCSTSLLPLFANNQPNNSKENSTTIFESLNDEEVLSVRVKLPIDSILIHKKTDKSFPAMVTYVNKQGVSVERPIKVKARGRSRRLACSFPPLKIKFSKKDLANDGIAETHKSLKLVTHCNDEPDALQNVYEEYLAYKIYNEITDQSLKVQLIRIYYQDMDSDNAFERYGILIEDIDELAERLGGKEVEGFGKVHTDFDKKTLQRFAMFQYLIGNEDWRIEFMRNVKFVELPNQQSLIPIPYDFDASGLVTASYAKADRDLQLASVKQRAFMGVFDNKSERKEAIEFFNTKKGKIYQMINACQYLKETEKATIINYFDDYYEIINTPKYMKLALPLKGRKSLPSNEEGGFPLG